MPARTVVIHNLSKFNGIDFQPLTAVEFTQMSGRAGRRGIDDLGHTVLLWSPYETMQDMHQIAKRRSFNIRSSFGLRYHMIAGLISRGPQEAAIRFIESSFLFHGLRQDHERAARHAEQLRLQAAEASCLTDERVVELEDYQGILKRQAKARKDAKCAAPKSSVERADSGVVIVDPCFPDRLLVVLFTQWLGDRLKVRTVDERGRSEILHFHGPQIGPETRLGQIKMPATAPWKQAAYRQSVASRLSEWIQENPDCPNTPDSAGAVRPLSEIQAEERAEHPASLRERAVLDADRQAMQGATSTVITARKADQRAQRTKQRLEQSTVGALGGMLRTMQELECADGWSLTDKGRILLSVAREQDMLLALILDRGLMSGLSDPELAGVASTLTYEHRGKETSSDPVYPSDGTSREAVGKIEALCLRIQALERREGMSLTRGVETGFHNHA